MFTKACVVGAGRVGRAAAARLGERLPTSLIGRDRPCDRADLWACPETPPRPEAARVPPAPGFPDRPLVVLCVPDREIAAVARSIPAGPWVAHTSGAASLETLAPHRRRFSVHPLQTFQLGLGPEQFDGAFAAVTGESDDAVRAGFALADLLGLEPFELDDADRPAYHAAATMAASFLVTLHSVAAELMGAAGAPPEALEPLMRRTIENGFAQTGPFVRGDWETVESHLEAIRARRPQLEPLYRALAQATQETGSIPPRQPEPILEHA